MPEPSTKKFAALKVDDGDDGGAELLVCFIDIVEIRAYQGKRKNER